MGRNTKIKIGVAVGALVVAIATPVALAQAGGDDVDPTVEPSVPADLLCLEVDGPMLGGVGFGEVPFVEVWPEDGEWLEGEGPEGFEGEWLDELPGIPEEILQILNEETAALAEYLDGLGIEHEVVEGPMGGTWVEWDWDDEAANQAVEDFYLERGEELFEGIVDTLPGIDFDFGFELPEDFPFGDLDIPEGFFDEGFVFDIPTFEGFGDFPDGEWEDFEFGPFEICIETPEAQVEYLTEEIAGLTEALDAAGASYETKTVTIDVPVWDPDDETATEAARDFYSGLHSEPHDWPFGWPFEGDDGEAEGDEG